MAANIDPIFSLVPNCATATIAAANTARDGSGSLVTLFTAGTNGSRIDQIKFISAQATAAASANMVVRVFITDTAGANPRLFIEALMTGLTPGTVVIGSVVIFDFINGVTQANATLLTNGIYGSLIIASGQIIKVAQSVYGGAADQNQVIAKGGNF